MKRLTPQQEVLLRLIGTDRVKYFPSTGCRNGFFIIGDRSPPRDIGTGRRFSTRTLEALVRAGALREVGRFAQDATEGPSTWITGCVYRRAAEEGT